jgi:hypothetical protein
VRSCHKLAETAAGERGDFRERFAFDQARRKLAGNRNRDLDRFAFELRFDRLQRTGSGFDAGCDAFERACDPPADLDLRVALTLRIAARTGGLFRLGELGRVLCKRDRRLALAAGGEIDVEQEFCPRTHQ